MYHPPWWFLKDNRQGIFHPRSMKPCLGQNRPSICPDCNTGCTLVSMECIYPQIGKTPMHMLTHSSGCLLRGRGMQRGYGMLYKYHH
jgi:hypothetical protein